MKKSSRIGLLGIVVVLCLIVLMVVLTLTIGQGSAETTRRIGTALGGTIGALAVFFAAMWHLLRKSGQ